MANWAYTYDDFNRLSTAAASPPWSTWGSPSNVQNMGCQYTYDRYGNRLSEQPYGTGSCLSTSATYSSNRNSTLTYDAAGNVLFDGTNVYKYDAENRLASVTSNVTGTTMTTTYQYNPEGMRITSTNSSGVTLKYGRGPDGQLQWTNYGTGTPEDIWFNGRHLGYLYVNSDLSLNHVVYSMVDQVGTERVRIQQNQSILSRFVSLPFGESSYTIGSNDDPIHYTGKERDQESGNDYFGARYYASNMGRFMSPDPSGLYYADPTNPQSLNLYSYALNNPLKNTDPTGMYCYYGSTDADVGDDSQYDFHSSQGECTQKDENGNQGQWIDDPSTEVNVNANGDGSMDSYSSSFDGTSVTQYDQHSQWQGDPDDKRIQTLASAINTQVGPLLNLGDAIAGCAANHYVLAPFAAVTSLLGAPVSKTAVFGRAAGMGGDASKFMSGASTAEYLARGGASAKFTGAAAAASKALTGTARVAGAVGRVAGPVALVLDAALIAKCVSDAGHH